MYKKYEESLNVELQNTTIEKYIKEANYKITYNAGDSASVAIIKYLSSTLNQSFVLLMNDEGKCRGISYTDGLYSKYMIINTLELGMLIGQDKNATCYYYLEDDQNKQAVFDSYCTEKDKEEIESLFRSYKYQLGKVLHLTEDELIRFAEEQYAENEMEATLESKEEPDTITTLESVDSTKNSITPNTPEPTVESEPVRTITMGEKNALTKAKSYLSHSAFSYTGLIKQLEFEGYTHEEAVYGVDNCGADWFEQASKKAASYLRSSSFSRDGLIKQLEYEGFTHDQAVYGVEQNGY